MRSFLLVLVIALAGVLPAGAQRAPFIVGACTHFGQGKGLLPSNLQMVRQAGITSIRDEVVWSGVEREKGRLVMPEAWDTYVRSTRRAGIDPLLILDYGNRFYDGGNKPHSDEAQDAFVRYARFVVEHFRKDVRLFEVWNEYDIGIGTPNQEKGKPEDYVELLRRTYPQIKAAHPGITVMGGAVTSAAAHGEWFERAAELGMMKYCDAVSIHSYNYSAKGRRRAPEAWLRWMEEVQAMLRRHNGGKDVPLYVTEMGWPTHVGDRGMTPDTAAAYLARMYLLARTLPYVRGIWWYDFQDDGWDPADNEHNFGLVRPDLTPKPAYQALRSVSVLVSRAVSAERIPTQEEDAWVLRLKDRAGKETLAIWSGHERDGFQVTLGTDRPRGPVMVQAVGATPATINWGRRDWTEGREARVQPDEVAITVGAMPVLVSGVSGTMTVRRIVRR